MSGRTAGLDGPARAAALRDYHQSQLAAIETQWTLDLQRGRPGHLRPWCR